MKNLLLHFAGASSIATCGRYVKSMCLLYAVKVNVMKFASQLIDTALGH